MTRPFHDDLDQPIMARARARVHPAPEPANIPTWNAPSAECQLATISVPINVSVRRADGTGRRLGSGTLTAALLPCYRVALPVLQG